MDRVVILESINSERVRARFAMFALVPVAIRPFYVDSGFVSAYKNIAADDLTALRAGEYAERIGEIQLNPGTNLATIKAHIEAAWQVFQNEIDDLGDTKYKFYGATWNGSSWTVGGV